MDQHKYVTAVVAGVTSQYLTILSDVTKRVSPQVSLFLFFFLSEFNGTWHNKQILGGTLVSEATDFICTANESCFFSSQSEEQRVPRRSQE